MNCGYTLLYFATALIINLTSIFHELNYNKIDLNPNAHSFKTISKAMACGWKEPVLPHPLNSMVGGGREECAFSVVFKKHEMHLHYHQEHIENKSLKLKSF
jgi:hypothetical protein